MAHAVNMYILYIICQVFHTVITYRDYNIRGSYTDNCHCTYNEPNSIWSRWVICSTCKLHSLPCSTIVELYHGQSPQGLLSIHVSNQQQAPRAHCDLAHREALCNSHLPSYQAMHMFSQCCTNSLNTFPSFII